ncbi:MAG: adenylate/guanylate cyclase domain-containing protein [Desulfobacula sp.]|uniref:CHASE2 domain-containing protein n=1 Tax=Desulfobacula sp. TaxID=2593537 RepID=UPI0025C02293|nr:adenylate/guanylate cyclase domain-containing protein [Desulfobacula sp.]MCD4719170.1 adenylate/guanylate cyclase domain-containing protein [Desulfobacula sp.]
MNEHLRHYLNLSSFLLGCVITFISCMGFYSLGNRKPALINAIDNRIMDIMFKIRGARPDSGKIIIVDIDEKSLKEIGQWPWPRNILADITKNLYKNDARAIGFDIVFAEKDRTSPIYYFKNLDPSITSQIPENILSKLFNNESMDHDSLFGQAISMGPTILGYVFQTQEDGLKSDTELPFPSSMIKIKPDNVNFQDLCLIPAYRAVVNNPLVSMAESEGFFNVSTDDSGTTRQVPLMMIMDNIPYPSLALETFRVGMKIPALTIQASGKIKAPKIPILGIYIGDKFISTDHSGQIFVNYRGPVNTFKYISAIDILTKPSLPVIKDKFVLIGSSSIGLFDLKTTPFSKSVPGIEINANIIDNLIKSDPFIYDIYTEIGLTYTLIIAGGLVLSLILSVLGPLAGGIGAVIFFCASITWNYYYFFLNNRVLGITYPIITCAGILLIISIFNSYREKKKKRYIQKAFSHYVSPDVVSQLLKNPKSLSLKGEEKELTVLFCDIRGFTSISEKMDSKDLGNFMNDYLTRMSQVIMKNKGTVDKFIGDAIMAFWGAPNEELDHAVKAVYTAMALKSELNNLENICKKRNLPNISVGIGINSGLMSVGNFGSKERFDYTVMGDNVNLASRLRVQIKTMAQPY